MNDDDELDCLDDLVKEYGAESIVLRAEIAALRAKLDIATEALDRIENHSKSCGFCLAMGDVANEALARIKEEE